MCMLKSSTRLKATKDIVCYKVCKYNGKRLSSFFYHFIWKLNHTYEAEHARVAPIKDHIYDGYFHTFTSPELCSRILKNEGTIMCKCIIPKGTYYFKGWHDDCREGYASKKLKIVEIL